MSIKHEEYLPLAKDLLTSFTRDLADFTAENSTYTNAYLRAFETKIDEVEAREAGDAVLTRQKEATRELYLLGLELKKPLKRLSVFIERAKIPTPLCTQIIHDVDVRNFEGVSDKLAALLQTANNYIAELKAKGMQDALLQTLADMQPDIEAKADAQTQLMKVHSATTSTNLHLYEELYAYIAEICQDGKLVYEGEQKATEYNINKMLAKLHVSSSNNSQNPGNTTPPQL